MKQGLFAEQITGNIHIIADKIRSIPIKHHKRHDCWQDSPPNMAEYEESLWKAVVMQAIVDATMPKPPFGQAGKKHKAIRWLTDYSDDFIDVCMLAGLSPERVRVQAKKALANPLTWRIAAGKSLRYLERKAMRARLRHERAVARAAEESPTPPSALIIRLFDTKETSIMTNKQHTLHQIFNRLCFHSGAPLYNMKEKRARFIASLACYPEDLICAAYHYLQHRIIPKHMPSEEDFIAFMQPEFERRQQAACMEDA